MINTNPNTGIRYGYIATQHLNPDLLHNLLYSHGTDLSYKEAYDEAKAGFIREFGTALEEAEIAAAETDSNMSESDKEKFIADHMLKSSGIEVDGDAEAYAELKLEQFSDTCEIDGPIIEGVYGGVKYRTSWLGGAQNLWIFEGPVGFARQLCSPCVPNAAHLDSGFLTSQEMEGHPERGEYTYECYVVPRDWMDDTERQLSMGV